MWPMYKRGYAGQRQANMARPQDVDPGIPTAGCCGAGMTLWGRVGSVWLGRKPGYLPGQHQVATWPGSHISGRLTAQWHVAAVVLWGVGGQRVAGAQARLPPGQRQAAAAAAGAHVQLRAARQPGARRLSATRRRSAPLPSCRHASGSAAGHLACCGLRWDTLTNCRRSYALTCRSIIDSLTWPASGKGALSRTPPRKHTAALAGCERHLGVQCRPGHCMQGLAACHPCCCWPAGQQLAACHCRWADLWGGLTACCQAQASLRGHSMSCVQERPWSSSGAPLREFASRPASPVPQAGHSRSRSLSAGLTRSSSSAAVL